MRIYNDVSEGFVQMLAMLLKELKYENIIADL